MIELKHPIFGFEQTNIEPNKAFTNFTKLLIKLTRNHFFKHQTKPNVLFVIEF